MKKFSKLFILLLVVGLLFAVAPTKQAQAATVVTDEAGLRAALAGTDDIELGASFTLAATVDVNRSVVIDGKGFTITGPTTYHAINVGANDVTIKNLTITGTTNGHNLQFYSVTGGVVTNVTLSNGGKAGMVVNGSQVTISGVTTTNNLWGGINVDQGSGVTAIPHLTVINVTTHTSPTTGITPAIWVDKGNPAWVSVGDIYSVVVLPNGYLDFFDNTEFATIAAGFPVHNETKDIYYANLQQAVAASAAGDIIKVYGTYVLDSVVTLDKAITLTCATGAKIQVSGTGDRFDIKAAATISGCEIEKTDKTGEQNIIRLNNADATNAKILNNKIHGQWVVGEPEVTRAVVVNAGALSGVEISGNEIYGLRQPAYISGTHTGTISDNYVHDTKGWVLEGGNLTFTGNTWANNVGDIAILLQCPAAYYTDIVAMSAANNGAVIEDQRMSPALLSVVYVDDNAAVGGNGTQAAPLQTIQAGIDRVIAGGTVNVADGTYYGPLTIDKQLSLIGPNSGINPNTGSRVAEAIILYPTGLTADADLVTVTAGGVLIDGFTIDGKDLGDTLWGEGIFAEANNLSVKNNIIKNFMQIGIRIYSNIAGPYYSGALLENNQVISDVAGRYFSYSGIYLQGAHGVVRGNVVDDANRGIQVQPYNHPSTESGIVENNTFSAYKSPIYFNYSASSTSDWVFRKNIATGIASPTASAAYFAGITVETFNGGKVLFDKNQVTLGAANATINYLYYEIGNVVGTSSATPNWWGQATGPAAGTIVGEAEYIPWCTDEACTTFGYPTPTTTRVPVTPVAGQKARVWVDLAVNPGEIVVIETQVGTTTTLIDATYHLDGYTFDNAGTPVTAHWYADIPGMPVGTVVTYRIGAKDTEGTTYNWTGFDYSYTVAAKPSTFTTVSFGTATPTPSLCGPSTLNVNASNLVDLTGFHVEILFDKTKIRIDSVEYLGAIGANPLAEPTNTLGNDTGRLIWGLARVNGDPKDGFATLIKIHFTPLVAEPSVMSVDSVNSILTYWPDAFEWPFASGPDLYIGVGGIIAKNVNTSVNYCNLSVALNAATDGQTVELLTDISTNGFHSLLEAGTARRAVTLDMKGFDLIKTSTSSNTYPLILVGEKVDLTILGPGEIITVPSVPGTAVGTAIRVVNGGTVTLGGTYTTPEAAALLKVYGGRESVEVQAGSSFIMNDGTVENGIWVHGADATVDINEGFVTTSKVAAAAIIGSGNAGESGTSITIDGGTIGGINAVAIYHPQGGSLTINGGTITGLNAIEMKAGSLVVTGGTITANGNFVAVPPVVGSGSTETGDAILINSLANPNGNLTVAISGGTITSTNGYALREFVPVTDPVTPTRTTDISVTGGYFTGGVTTDAISHDVAFTTVAPAVLKLTGGSYGTDPDLYTYAPYAGYFESPWWKIGQIAGTIAWDGATGQVPGESLGVTVTGNVIDFNGNIAWYQKDVAVGRTQGNRVGVEINAPAGFVTNEATITVFGSTYNWDDLNDGDNFVWVYPKVTATPQSFTVVVTWKTDVVQTFTINVAGTLQMPPAPIISSADIQGYYLTGEKREFNVSLENPTIGADYALMIFDYKLAGVTTADITSFEYYAQDLGTWIVMGSRAYETYGNCSDNTGVCGQFGWAPGGFGPVPAGFTNPSKFRVNFANGFSAPLALTLDLSGKLDVADTAWTHLTTFTGNMKVYTTPVITSTLAGPYLIGVPASVDFTITNPNGLPGPFDLVLNLPAGTTIVIGTETYTCGMTGCVIPVSVAAPSATVTMQITFPGVLNAAVTGSLLDTLADPDRPVASFTSPVNVVVLGTFNVTGTVTMQGRTTRAGVQLKLTGPTGFIYGPYTATSNNLATGNYSFTAVAENTYEFKTTQPRYLNIGNIVDDANGLTKSVIVNGVETLSLLWLRAGNAVWTDNIVDNSDSGMVASGYINGIGGVFADADVNFDGIANIQDLALVGGNYFLTSATAYGSWVPVAP